jgi:LysR family transcriptional activator of nhaA
MQWLNYHHLYYFWTVLRTGGIRAASAEVRISPPAISAQLRTLEEALGEKLLARKGRRLEPTEMGRLVQGYAEEIFGLGRELMEAVKQGSPRRPWRLVIGVDDVLPKEVARWLIEPALELPEPVHILCREAGLERLLGDLATHQLDLVLSDAPVTPTLSVRAYNHPLGECGVLLMATRPLARRYRARFPHSLDRAPVLLPTDDTAIRRQLDRWFDHHKIRPVMVGEFEDYALLATFGQAGLAVFPVPAILEEQFRRFYRLERIGRAEGVRARYYAISVERKLKHPAVVAISERARRHLMEEEPKKERQTRSTTRASGRAARTGGRTAHTRQ